MLSLMSVFAVFLLFLLLNHCSSDLTVSYTNEPFEGKRSVLWYYWGRDYYYPE